MSKIMFKTLQWNHWPVACGSTWVLNILMSLLRVQTMENCGSFVNSNPELSLPCLSYSWSQLYNKKPVYSNRQIPVFSCQLMVQFKSGTRLPSEEKSKYQGKECQKIIEQSEVNLMGDWDEGKGGHSFSFPVPWSISLFEPIPIFALLSTIKECSACLVVSQTHHLERYWTTLAV